jgi:dihydropyrimidinase
MFPRKGSLQPGADADIVVYDPSWEGVFSADTHHMNIDYSPLEGLPVKGRCAAVTVRGKVQVLDGEFVGEQGFGRFVKRDCVH